MAIDWIYDTTYVSFGVEWNAAYASGGRVTIAPRVYRWDRYNTIDGSQFWQTLYYEPNGATGGPWSGGWGSGSGTREVDSYQTRYYPRRASAYTVQLKIETADGFGTAYDGYFHTIGSVTRTATYYVPALPPSFNTITAERVSDNQVNITWTAASGNIKAVCIERSMDGGSYSEVAVIWNASATSWQDTTTTADHAYTYRARYHHEGAYGAYSNTASVTTTPAAPTAIETAAIQGTTVTVNVQNASPVATSLQYQVSSDGGSTWGAVQTSANLNTFDASVPGTGKVRVRNAYDGASPALVSAWLESEVIVTVTQPNAPTLGESPAVYWDIASGNALVTWTPNHPDNSAQEAFQFRFKFNGASSWYETITRTSADWFISFEVGEYMYDAGIDAPCSVEYQVATKGAYESYGPFSQSRTFYVYTAPQVNITSPGETVDTMPLQVRAKYYDMPGDFRCTSASFVVQRDGAQVYPERGKVKALTIGTEGGVTVLSADIAAGEFLPANRASYTVVVSATSSSSLQASANAPFNVDFNEPVEGALQIINDPETGYASLVATFDNAASEITYTGSTNAQYESTEGYVRSLTVEGKSAKWNQLYRRTSESGSGTNYSYTVSNGKVTLTTTATATTSGSNDLAFYGSEFTAGHKYLFLCSGDSRISLYLKTYGVGSGNILSVETPSYNNCAFVFTNLPAGTYVFYPQLIDLTAMYGAGNEPTTLTDPRIAWLKAYALAHPAYDAGSLVSIEGAGVRGRNLLPTPPDFTNTANGSTISCSKGTISITGAASGSHSYTVTLPSAVKVSSGMYLHFMNQTFGGTQAENCVVRLRKNGTNVSPNDIYPFTAANKIVSLDNIAGKEFNQIFFYIGANYGGDAAIMSPMVCTDNDSHTYEFYIAPTTITTTLRSAGSIHDQLQAGKDEWTVSRKVGSVDLGSLTWIADGTSVSGVYRMAAQFNGTPNTPDNDTPANFLCAKYQAIPVAQTWATAGIGISYGSTGNHIRVYDPNYNTSSSASAFKTAMSGVYLFYELATPTTDPETSMSTIELGSAFTVATDLDSTFEMTTWDGSADAVSVSVSRVNADGSITPLLTDGASGSGIVDKYAPLNTPYQYAVTTTASSKAVRTVFVDNIISSQRWFAYWGDSIAWARWNPSGGVSITRPEKKRVHYAGRTYPVSYDSLAIDQQNTLKVKALLDEWSDGFAELMRDGGRGVYKGADGSVFWADFEYSTSQDYTSATAMRDVSLTITRIDGEQL